MLRALLTTVVAAPLAIKLGRILDKQPKLVTPAEAAADPLDRPLLAS